MISHEELKTKAEKYARHYRPQDTHQVFVEMLSTAYADGFMQGYSVAGGRLSDSSTSDPSE